MKFWLVMVLVLELSGCATSRSWQERVSPVEAAMSRELVDKPRVGLLIITDLNYSGSFDPFDTGGHFDGLAQQIQAGQEGNFLERFSQNKNFHLVDRDSVRSLLSEASLEQAGLIEQDTRTELGKLSGATHVLLVQVSVLANYGDVVVRRAVGCRLIELEHGEVLAAQTSSRGPGWWRAPDDYGCL